MPLLSHLMFHPRYFVGGPKYLTMHFSVSMFLNSSIFCADGADMSKSPVVMPAVSKPDGVWF